MDENNNFFGLVSKIGSLINNNKNKDKDIKKKGHEKKYNIKISTDDEEDLDNIDNDFDEESEEEEEEEKLDEDNKDNKTKENDNSTNDEINSEKEKIKNMVQEIMNNNDNNKNNEEDEKEDEKEEEKVEEEIEEEDNNINNINNTNNIDNINNTDDNIEKTINNKKPICLPILNNSFPVSENNIQNGGSTTFYYNENASCHIMLKKGNEININEYITIPILFMEKRKNIFYKMGMKNEPSYEPAKYLFFFDEHYIYFAKDEIILDEMDEETRRITKIVSLFDIKDFSTENDNEKFLIKFLIIKEDNKEKEISFYIEQKYFSGFMKNFNLKLSIYGIDFFSYKNSK